MINEFNTPTPRLKFIDRRKIRAPQSAPSGIIVSVDGTVFRFSDVDAFSFAVESRTAVSSSLYKSIWKMSLDNLTTLAAALKAEEKLLIEILEKALTASQSITSSLYLVSPETIRGDHYWREIIASVCECDSADAYLQIALVKYLQFLSSYAEVVRLTYTLKSNPDEQNLHRAGFGEVEAAPHETALFDVLQFSDAGRMINPYRRLPQGEAVTLHALPGHPIALLLAKYTFELVNDDGWALIDSRNVSYSLNKDLNYVGRGRENDIALNSDYRNVSRKHVIIHPLDDHSVVLIDLSSHGTFVPPRQVDVNSAAAAH